MAGKLAIVRGLGCSGRFRDVFALAIVCRSVDPVYPWLVRLSSDRSACPRHNTLVLPARVFIFHVISAACLPTICPPLFRPPLPLFQLRDPSASFLWLSLPCCGVVNFRLVASEGLRRGFYCNFRFGLAASGASWTAFILVHLGICERD